MGSIRSMGRVWVAYALAASLAGSVLACGDDDSKADAGDAGPQPLNIVLVNDDGWETPGIQQLKLELRKAGYRVVLVAPDTGKSGVGAALTFGSGALIEHGTDEYSLEATPATCVHAAVQLLEAEGQHADLIVSGTNDNINLGRTATLSGTVGGVAAGLLLGIPGIASSSFATGEMTEPDAFEAHYQRVAKVITELVGRIDDNGDVTSRFPAGVALSVNYPPRSPQEIKGLKVAPQGNNSTYHLTPTLTGNLTRERPLRDGADEVFYMDDYVTVTPLSPSYGAKLDQATMDALMSADSDAQPMRRLEILVTAEETWDSEGVGALADALIADGHNVTVSAPEVASRGGSTRYGLTMPCMRMLQREGDTASPDAGMGQGDLDAGVAGDGDGDGTPPALRRDVYSTNPPPSVCIAAAISAMSPRPDLVISGIHGRNHAGQPLIFSGALGAAVAAMGSGYPSMTVSTAGATGAALVAAASDVASMVAAMTHAPDGLLPSDVALNINFGAGATTADLEFTHQGLGSDFSYRFVGDGELMNDDGPAVEADEAPGADTTAIAAGKLSVMGVVADWSAPQDVFGTIEMFTDGLLEAVPYEGSDAAVAASDDAGL